MNNPIRCHGTSSSRRFDPAANGFIHCLHSERTMDQFSSTMLRSRALTTALNKLSTGGIRSAMLFNPEGVLLAFSSLADESERSKAAIAANIWNIYQHHLETSEAVIRCPFRGFRHSEGAQRTTIVSVDGVSACLAHGQATAVDVLNVFPG
ncbi:hypothetical protein CRM22_007333 [Opisthorchis felineus]|uniref:Roadblock/LAMTOR2 domain-containing protein n=1 Tax=Opisthorchis felineus TaxID=147828 RepID=A0A4S2LN77_OPIFE|nr:hypothetical protein CRM22_007333 [Opisthorchis felineus]